jgi:glycerophosphoryl diester phosphodiesterase
MIVYSQFDKSGNTVFFSPMKSFIKGVNHRGYVTAPENTLPAYVLSAKKGFRFVETDISFTSDNVPVCLHDETIDRTSNGSGKITELTFAQVRSYDFGSWKSAEYAGTQIPTLEEFIILCRNLGLHPYIEIKNTAQYTDAQLQMIVDIVNSHGMRGNVTYISFTSTLLKKISTFDPYARLGYVCSQVTERFIELAQSLMNGTNNVFLDSGQYSTSQVDLCKAANMPLECWTIDSKSVILALDDYISGITSNSINAEFVIYEKAIES